MNTPSKPDFDIDTKVLSRERRGFLGKLGGFAAATAVLPLLPVTARTSLAGAQTPAHESPPNNGNAFFD